MKLLPSVYLHCSPALLMEFKHTTMATPSPNNSTAPSGHNSSNNAGPAASHHHQSQSQHITTMSSMQGECGLTGERVRVAGSAHSAAVKVNGSGASRGRLRLLPGLKSDPQGSGPVFPTQGDAPMVDHPSSSTGKGIVS